MLAQAISRTNPTATKYNQRQSDISRHLLPQRNDARGHADVALVRALADALDD